MVDWSVLQTIGNFILHLGDDNKLGHALAVCSVIGGLFVFDPAQEHVFQITLQPLKQWLSDISVRVRLLQVSSATGVRRVMCNKVDIVLNNFAGALTGETAVLYNRCLQRLRDGPSEGSSMSNAMR